MKLETGTTTNLKDTGRLIMPSRRGVRFCQQIRSAVMSKTFKKRLETALILHYSTDEIMALSWLTD